MRKIPDSKSRIIRFEYVSDTAEHIAKKYGVSACYIYRWCSGSKSMENLSKVRSAARRRANAAMFGEDRMNEIDEIYLIFATLGRKEQVVFKCVNENYLNRFHGLLYRWNKKHTSQFFLSGSYDRGNNSVTVTCKSW